MSVAVFFLASVNANAILLNCGDNEQRVNLTILQNPARGCNDNNNITAKIGEAEYCVSVSNSVELQIGDNYQACVIIEEEMITITDAVDGRLK